MNMKKEFPILYRFIQEIYYRAHEDETYSSLMTTFFINLRPLLSNVNLWCNYDRFISRWYDEVNYVPNFLNRLLPLIDSVNSIHFYDDQAFDLVHEKFADKFFAAKVVSINYKIMKGKYEWVRLKYKKKLRKY